MAARSITDGERALALLTQRAQMDTMPLLSLLQAQPLKLQAAHLSFQEYFAARAIFEGKVLPAEPWELTSWWSNALYLGVEMGPAFNFNLLKSAGNKHPSTPLTHSLI